MSFLKRAVLAVTRRKGKTIILFTSSEVGRMAAVGLAILIAGTILPAATVVRYKPRAILSSAS